MTERSDHAVAVAVGALGGIVLVLLGCSPTGSATTDVPVLVATAAAAVWAMSSLRWSIVVAATGAAALWATPGATTIALIAAAVVVIGTTSVVAITDGEHLRPALLAAVTLALLGEGRTAGPHGVGAVAIVLAVAALSTLGLRLRPQPVRRRVLVAFGATAFAGFTATAAFAASGWASADDLRTGDRAARNGIAALERADIDLARRHFGTAASSFDRAARGIRAPWTRPARLVPIVGQHHRAATTLTEAAADAARALEVELEGLDVDALRFVDGRVDIDAIRSLAGPLDAVEATLVGLDRAVNAADDPWLLEPVRDRLRRITEDVTTYVELADTAEVAIELAPSVLGEDEPRRYLVMFTTPAEARGSGGFMGNFAEVRIDDGRIDLTRFGRHDDLTRAADGDLVLNDPPADWLKIYGPQGFATGIDGPVRDAWKIIGLSPHFPSTGAVAADLYPQSGGGDVDGVISFDVFALQRLVGLVGPIEAAGRELTGRNTARYLLVDQYQLSADGTNRARIDALETIALEVVDRLLSTSPPNPVELGTAMAPAVRQRRVTAWMVDEEEQRLISDIGLAGELLGRLDGRNGLSVVVVDDGASKMSSYLGRSMTVTPTPEGDRVTVTIRHGAPVADLSRLAIGRTSDVPDGWMRLSITLASDRPIGTTRKDGAVIGFRSAVEAGVSSASVTVELPPGGEVTLEFEVVGAPSPEGLVIDPHPLVVPEQWSVDGTDPAVYTERTIVR